MADAGNSILPSRLVLCQDSGQQFCTMTVNLFGQFLQVLIPEAKDIILVIAGYLMMLRVLSVYDRK